MDFGGLVLSCASPGVRESFIVWSIREIGDEKVACDITGVCKAFTIVSIGRVYSKELKGLAVATKWCFDRPTGRNWTCRRFGPLWFCHLI